MSDLKNISCFLCTFAICYYVKPSGHIPIKILNKSLTLTSLPSLSALPHSCLGLSSSIDIP